MRIIAGTYRSRKLNTLAGENTRPTQDKIKEAIFSSLGAYFHGGKMLDLFAGSGSMGLEALSRGMDKIYLNDHQRSAIKVIQSNIEILKAEKECVVSCLDYMSMLKKVREDKFDLIFLDPPYANKVLEECLYFIEENDMLEVEGYLILESSNEDIFKENYHSFTKVKEKVYGITRITYYRKEF